MKDRYSKTNPPIYEADAPIIIKTTEKPETKEIAEKRTFFLIFASYSEVSLSSDKPVMKEKYPGIKGNIHGEKKDINPEANAAEYDMVSLNIIIFKLLRCRDVCRTFNFTQVQGRQ